MPFKINYEKVERLLRNMVLDVRLARAICRKAGVWPFMGGGASLDWLIALFWENPEYNVPTDPQYPSVTKDSPEKASAEDFDIAYANDHSGWLFQPIASYDIYESRPTYWGAGKEFYGGANFDVGPGDFNDPMETHPFITGQTVYDPFPYPDRPCYFYADLKHFTSIEMFYGPRVLPAFGGTFAADLVMRSRADSVSGKETAAPYVYTSQPVVIKLWASVDELGATWEGPSWDGDPNMPMRLNGPVNRHGYYSSSGQLKGKFQRDGVLMKLTAHTYDTRDMIYITHHGVGAYRGGR